MSAMRRSTYSMLLISAFCVSGLGPASVRSAAGMPPHRARDVQFFADDPEARAGDLPAQPLHGDLLEQVVML